MLIKVKMLDYNLPYSYAPPTVDAIVNTEEIVSAKITEARGEGPHLFVRFRDGSSMTIQGRVEDLLGKE